MKKVFILDSFALMAYFLGQQGSLQVQELLQEAEKGKCHLKLCSINWGEIVYSIARTKGKVACQHVITQMAQYTIDVIDPDRELVYAAAMIKSIYPMSYADCFAAALSLKEKAVLVTGDKEFSPLKNEIKIHWLF